MPRANASKSSKASARATSSSSLTFVRPSEIWYTQTRIRDRFSGCDLALEDVARAIEGGTTRAEALPPMAVIAHDVEDVNANDESANNDEEGRKNKSARAESRQKERKTPKMVRRYYGMNNRRLWVLKRCEASGALEASGGMIGVRMESAEVCSRLLRKGSRHFRLDRCTPGPVKLIRAEEAEDDEEDDEDGEEE